MTKKIKWRLGELPTPDELRALVVDGILTKEEAREILFAEEDNTKRDEKSLEAEIKFLRELVERLSKNQQTVITTIREIERPYRQYPWYQPYYTWCVGTNTIGSGTAGTAGTVSGSNLVNLSTAGLQTSAQLQNNNQTNAAFSSIKTF